MFASIRRHQHWIWYIVVVVIIISFVVFFSPSMGRGPAAGGRVNLGSIQGRPITRQEWEQAHREITLFLHLNYREDADKMLRQMQMGNQLDREIYNRIFLGEKMKELNIEVKPAATAQWIREHLGDPNTKTIDRNALKKALEPHFSLEDLDRFARHEIGRAHLLALFGQSGKLLTSQEAEVLYRRENQPLAVEVAVFSLSNHLSSVSVSPAALGQYYTNNMPEYRVPERRQVGYVRFDLTNFFADADQEVGKLTNVTQAVEMEYQKRGSNFFKDATDVLLSPEAAKQKIRDDFRTQVARRIGERKANDFVHALYDRHEQNPKETDLLEKIAATNGLPVSVSSPFDERGGPPELKAPASFARVAFDLTAEEPFTTTPIVGEDAVYVLNLNKRIPSEVQPYEAVKDRVLQDFQRAEALKIAQREGEKFREAATNGLAQGKSFSAIAQETKVKSVVLPKFAASTRSMPNLEDNVNFSLVQNVALRLNPGRISPFVDSEDGGMVVYLKERLPIDESTLRSELASSIGKYREQRQIAAFSEWFQHLPQDLRFVPPARTR